jgi:PAS domain S-box-containing protein
MKWFDITHPDDIAPDSERFERFLSGEIKGYTIAKRYLRPDGSSVWVNIKIARLLLEERPDLTHICIAEDITDRVNAEEELKDLLYHDVLTGFYNHSYYEKQKHLLDTGKISRYP